MSLMATFIPDMNVKTPSSLYQKKKAMKRVETRIITTSSYRLRNRTTKTSATTKPLLILYSMRSLLIKTCDVNRL